MMVERQAGQNRDVPFVFGARLETEVDAA